jgi:hypothetical protein
VDETNKTWCEYPPRSVQSSLAFSSCASSGVCAKLCLLAV